MPAFKKYPTVADGATRRQRKAAKKTVFAYNAGLYSENRRARRKARKEAKESGQA